MPFFFEEEGDKKKKEIDEENKKIPETEYNDVAGTAPGGLLIDELIRGDPKATGEFLVSRTAMDQIITVNPDCLPGQAEIIYMIFLYRLVKWHFVPVKANEEVHLNPIHAPPFFTMQAAKEKLEQQIKQGLNLITQTTADYELFKNDLRKYGEILDYFMQAKKGDEHVLRSLFVDRVDTHTGEGYSMISMARRWPTIITDFIKLREDDTDIEKIKERLKVPLAEAVVLKTKNEIYKHWKKYFFRDIKERYARIKNLLLSTEKQLEEYSNWIKPYINKYKKIREAAEFGTSFGVTNAQVFAFTPLSGIRARLWFYRGFEPEEMSKPFDESNRIEVVDDFVLRWAKKIEYAYGVSFVREYNKKKGKNLPEDDDESRRIAIKEFFKGLTSVTRTHEMVQYVTVIDKRYRYFALYDIDYEGDYIKGSQGPLEMEDIYYHIYPSVVSINVLLVMHLELHAKELRFERYVEKLIGTSDIEAALREEVELAFKDVKKKAKKEKSGIAKRISASWKAFKQSKNVKVMLDYLRKGGPYETNVKERLSKEYANYLGSWTNYIYDLLKEICYKMSGVKP